MGRFWLVELEPELEALHTTRTGVWCGIKSVNGVRSVTDMRAISVGTLSTFLLSDAEFAQGLEAVRRRKEMTSPDHVIRAYWKRVRQPRLPEVN
jgi:hypothetical protein